MLVAEKKQYTGIYYPHEIEVERPISVPRPKAVPKTRSRAGKMVSHIVLIIIGFAICSFTVARFAVIAQKQQEIVELGKVLERQQVIQEYMTLELASRGNLDEIEEFAKNDLEMDYPHKGQILMVDLPEKTNKAEVETASLASGGKESLWSRLVSLLD
ncbi:MAG TPA: hypothetical protein VFD89_03960 [Clostridia bacterium]|nr:hypothetical protein [Clostridia bacterium]